VVVVVVVVGGELSPTVTGGGDTLQCVTLRDALSRRLNVW